MCVPEERIPHVQRTFWQKNMPMHTYQYAFYQHQSGNLETAEKIYRDILENNPNNVEVLHLLAILLSQKQDFLAARFYLEKAIWS